MGNVENPEHQYPLLLKVLLAFGVMFLGALGILIFSMILNMLGFAYGMNSLLSLTIVMEQAGILLLGVSIVMGGAISIVGMTMRTLTSPEPLEAQHEKQKNENRLYDIREQGLTVEEVLEDMSIPERELLAEKLAESRLAIREDGTLIPLEQAEKLDKIERFING